MAWIVSFTVEGLAGRSKPVSQLLHRNVNVFWGFNGSGKTSLLKILHSAMRNDSSSLLRVPFKSARVVIQDGASRLERSISNVSEYQPTLDAETVEFDSDEMGNLWREAEGVRRHNWQTRVLVGQDSSYLRRPILHSYMPISRVTRNLSGISIGGPSPQRQDLDDAYLDELFAYQVKRRWQNYSTTALARIREVQQDGLARILSVLFGGGTSEAGVRPKAGVAEESYDLVKSFLSAQSLPLALTKRQFITRYGDDPRLWEVVEQVRSVSQEVEETLTPQREFQNILEHLYSGGKHIVLDSRRGPRSSAMQVSVGGATIPLESLSSGEKQLLQLLLESLAAGSSTVMIDEPELSMHVDWQLNLVASMTRVNPDCQLLLATHSPEIMADVPDEFIFQL